MATGSLTLTLTLPTTGSPDTDWVSRQLVSEMLDQAAQAIGSSRATAGNLIKSFSPANGLQVVGTWNYTVPSS